MTISEARDILTRQRCDVHVPREGWQPGTSNLAQARPVRSLRRREQLSVGPTLDGAASLRRESLAGLRPDDDLRGTRHPRTPTLRCPRTPARVGSRAIANPAQARPVRSLRRRERYRLAYAGWRTACAEPQGWTDDDQRHATSSHANAAMSTSREGWQPARPRAGPPGKKPRRRERSRLARRWMAQPACARESFAGLRPDDDLRGTRHPTRQRWRCPRSPARVGSRAIAQPGAGRPVRSLRRRERSRLA